ncbi:TPA: hypothetical protein I1870_002154 [Staphylococcus pseudintermedius]|nr:hypothetical protein [Staphylococcus pseudintermedius]
MTDKSQAKSYLKQYFGTKRYLYQDGRKRFCRKRKSQSRNDVSRQTRCKEE